MAADGPQGVRASPLYSVPVTGPSTSSRSNSCAVSSGQASGPPSGARRPRGSTVSRLATGPHDVSDVTEEMASSMICRSPRPSDMIMDSVKRLHTPESCSRSPRMDWPPSLITFLLSRPRAPATMRAGAGVAHDRTPNRPCSGPLAVTGRRTGRPVPAPPAGAGGRATEHHRTSLRHGRHGPAGNVPVPRCPAEPDLPGRTRARRRHPSRGVGAYGPRCVRWGHGVPSAGPSSGLLRRPHRISIASPVRSSDPSA